ncbi:hypothetical protein A0U91_10785 [Acetobacter persici]|uniref:Uncharacterized protein n=1 Tax=Acetobacter persici TaxID=1076596 RepID=A0A1U9LFT3_9PROT|nr:hypothetical protein A0U91_10785 [Acetobacter persici]
MAGECRYPPAYAMACRLRAGGAALMQPFLACAVKCLHRTAEKTCWKPCQKGGTGQTVLRHRPNKQQETRNSHKDIPA